MTPEQLAAIGLKADATQEEINARLAELAAAEGDGDPAGGTGEGGGEGDPANGGEGGEPDPATGGEGGGEGTGGEPAPAASGPRPGMVEVPAETWAETQANAAAGAQVADDIEITRRDDTIVAACKAGKISPSATASMENLHTRDKDAFYNLLTASVDKGGLAPNVIPVSQRGSAGGGEGAGGGSETSHEVPPAKMAALFPEVNFDRDRGRV